MGVLPVSCSKLHASGSAAPMHTLTFALQHQMCCSLCIAHCLTHRMAKRQRQSDGFKSNSLKQHVHTHHTLGLRFCRISTHTPLMWKDSGLEKLG